MAKHNFDDSFEMELAKMELPQPTKMSKLQVDVKNPCVVSANELSAPGKKPSNSHAVLVHPNQRGNPILKSIVNTPLEFRDDIIPDYVVGRTSCVLYLSLKYHVLNPEYICDRLRQLGQQYELRVLLVQVDTPEPQKALKNLTRISLLANLTLMLAWNIEEAGKIIETYKLFEKRPPDLIMERVDSSPHQKLVSALTNIKPVNKTDATGLLQNFGKLENIINASEDRLSQVVGLGPRKAKKLHKTLQESFFLNN